MKEQRKCTPKKNSVGIAMKVYRALYETRHFEFEGYGLSADEAIDCLIEAWKVHCRQYKVDAYWKKDGIMDIKTNISASEIDVPSGIRDGWDKLYPKVKKEKK